MRSSESRSKAALLCALAATALAPSAARADGPPSASPSAPAASTSTSTSTSTATEDAVYLRNGGLFRGHITELATGDHVTIAVEKGETRQIAWSEIERVVVASAPPPSTPAEAPPALGPRARVHVTSARPVILYRKPAGTNAWSKACLSPCDIELPIRDTYRVAGNGMQQSKEFALKASPGGTVELTVDPSSTGGMVLGGLIGGAGATAATVGLLMTVVGVANRRCFGDDDDRICRDRDFDRETVRDAGLVTLGVGSVLTVIGLIVFLNNSTTDIDQQTGGKGAASTPRTLDAFLRQPTWKGARSSSEAAMTAPPATFPLSFTATF